jgi:hypothetical protein
LSLPSENLISRRPGDLNFPAAGHLSTWRRQLGIYGEAGLAPRKRGRKPKLDAKDRQLLAALKENAGLEKKLRVANALIALQKKAHEILGLTMTEGER